jgi:hypothetical protein
MKSISKKPNYFDLTKRKIEELSIIKQDIFTCNIVDKNGEIFNGFILATTPKTEDKRICEISLQKSSTDNKYQPRLIFLKTNKDNEIKEKDIQKKPIRIDFLTGESGYREFWQMIAFLYKYKDLTDTGDFIDEFKVISDKQFIKFLNDKENFGDLEKTKRNLNEIDSSSNQNLNLATNLKILKDNLSKIDYFINNKSSETEIQKWIDEDKHKNRRARCMIFGLEYLNHKREGLTNGNRYDLLTRIGVGDDNEERVLIELKGADADIFKIKSEKNSNGGIIEEFNLSESLTRAIPQILEYKRKLEEKSESLEDEDMRRMGEFSKITISKCIIVIGAKKDDPRWRANFLDLKKSFNSILEIWTYTDLRNKLFSTIKNLEHTEEPEAINENHPECNFDDEIPF